MGNSECQAELSELYAVSLWTEKATFEEKLDAGDAVEKQ